MIEVMEKEARSDVEIKVNAVDYSGFAFSSPEGAGSLRESEMTLLPKKWSGKIFRRIN